MFRKIFAVLDKDYYLDYFEIGLLLSVPATFIFTSVAVFVWGKTISVIPFCLVYCVINSALYPYSAWLADRIEPMLAIFWGILDMHMLKMLCKILESVTCWIFTPLIAPIGLAFIHLERRSIFYKPKR